MAETLGTRILDAAERLAIAASNRDDGREERAALVRLVRSEADAAEALALATAARVEASARYWMAYRLHQAARPQNGARWTRAAMRASVASNAESAARSAECAALERWREVTGG